MWHSGIPAVTFMCSYLCIGHYKALEWSETEQKYVENPNLGILVEVDVSTKLGLFHESVVTTTSVSFTGARDRT